MHPTQARGSITHPLLAHAANAHDAFADERRLNDEPDVLKTEQRQTIRKALAHRCKNHIHQVTAKLVRQHRVFITEDLSIGNMTAAAKGTVEKSGKNVATKAGLNRAILDAAPGSCFLSTRRQAAALSMLADGLKLLGRAPGQKLLS